MSQNIYKTSTIGAVFFYTKPDLSLKVPRSVFYGLIWKRIIKTNVDLYCFIVLEGHGHRQFIQL